MLACGYRKGRAGTLAVCFAVSAFIFLCDVPRLTDRFRPSLAGSFFGGDTATPSVRHG